MPRVTPLPLGKAPDEIQQIYAEVFGARDPVCEPGTASGTPGNWWTAWGQVPGILRAFRAYPAAECPLNPQLRELAVLRTGYARASQFVFSQHCKSLRGLGVSDEKIAAIPHWTVSDLFNDQERTVLAYADCLSGADGRVPDAVFEKLKTFWDDEQIFEFTYITCLYDMHAVITRALRMEYDNRAEPIVEVAAPEGFSAADFLGGPPSTPR